MQATASLEAGNGAVRPPRMPSSFSPLASCPCLSPYSPPASHGQRTGTPLLSRLSRPDSALFDNAPGRSGTPYFPTMLRRNQAGVNPQGLTIYTPSNAHGMPLACVEHAFSMRLAHPSKPGICYNPNLPTRRKRRYFQNPLQNIKYEDSSFTSMMNHHAYSASSILWSFLAHFSAYAQIVAPSQIASSIPTNKNAHTPPLVK